jgi:Helix-turn-helix domain
MTAQTITGKTADVASTPAAVSTHATNTPKLTYNPAETAKMLGIGHVQVRQLVRAGDLPTLPGRNINIPLIAIERYLERLGGAK